MTGPVDDAAVLAFHRALVETPSVSGGEKAAVDFVAGWLKERGAEVDVLERNVIAWSPSNPRPGLIFNSHLDTVPAGSAWTRDPWDVGTEDDRHWGLGSNDAKASVAAMAGAFITALHKTPGHAPGLTLVADEETGGRGTEIVLPHLAARGWQPRGIVVGEPTGLDVATAQKGLLILELKQKGAACHSANARALGARNAITALARDLVAVEGLDLGPDHAALGPTTLQPTVLEAGGARNTLAAQATCVLDLRTTPGVSHDALVERVRGAVDGEVSIISSRLVPMECSMTAEILRAAQEARPSSRLYGSPTMSDWVYCGDTPAIKCGPGLSARSHRPDEYVLKTEILEGLAFYSRLLVAFNKEEADVPVVEQGS